MPVILDNVIFSLQKNGGISIVWKNLIERLERDGRFDLCYLEYNNIDNIFRQELRLDLKQVKQRSLGFMNYQRYLSPYIDVCEPFVFHSSYYRISDNPYAHNITNVLDFTYELYKGGLSQFVHSWQKFRAIYNSKIVVCISESTKRDLYKFVPDASKMDVRVIYNGVSDDYHKLDTTPYPEYHDCVLYVGSRDSYKNFEFTVKALRDSRFRLIICGDELNCKELKLLNTYLGSDRYIVIDKPSNEELNKIYNSVFCFLYPSSNEGFGIPVLEAQLAHCPVIALNCSSIPEVIGAGYPMLPELTESALSDMLGKFDRAKVREEAIALGAENAKRFSWDKMASEYMALYEELDV